MAYQQQMMAAGYGYQDWYEEELHGVLMEPFPLSQTRGGFAEVYTSHEIYCYKIGALTREMVTAQGLGCVLRMARKLGWSIDGSPHSRVRGKSVGDELRVTMWAQRRVV